MGRGAGTGAGGSGGEKQAWPLKAEGMRTDFIHSAEREPHIVRHKEIIKKYPEIQKLYGSDWRPAPIAVALIIGQLALAYHSKNWSNGFFFLVAWVYGGAAAHALSLMTHELSHNLVFASPKANEYFGIICNMGMGIPSSTMFKRYHMEHHMYQGDYEKDTDIPTAWEGRFFTNTFLKAIWLFCQPLFYALRPSYVRPKSPMPMDIQNILLILVSDLVVVHHCGLRGLLFLVASTLLGMGFHPVAGHFISEHYVFPGDKVETYSYYGALNWICWNVGYHNEHHDFPKVPGWRLPKIREIAPEYYNNLPQHKSWTYVLWKYVTSPDIGPFNRVIRGKKAN
jgi:sphingolipid delta-4 desaturase